MTTEQPQATFVSYARGDEEFALRLCKDLKAAGASVWLDQIDIKPGQRWARAVQDALISSSRMLVILSPLSVDSTNVDDEISFALDEQKTIIPALHRDCIIPFRLRPFQYVDFRTDYGKGLGVLLHNLGPEQAPQPEISSPAASTKRQPDIRQPKERAEPVQHLPSKAEQKAVRSRTPWIISIILFLLWFIGFFSLVVGGWIHLLLILAIGSFIFSLVSARRVL